MSLGGRLYVMGGRDASGATATMYVLDISTAVENGPEAGALALSAPAPNPATGLARLSLEVGDAGPVLVEAFDALGRRVAMLHDGMLPAGSHALTWTGRDETGAPLPAGVYAVRATQGEHVAVRRLTVTR